MGMTKDGQPDPIEQDTEQGEDGPDLFTRVHDLEVSLNLLQGYVLHLRTVIEEVLRETPNMRTRTWTWEEWLDPKLREVPQAGPRE